MKFKNWLSIILVVSLVFIVTACGVGKANKIDDIDNNETTTESNKDEETSKTDENASDNGNEAAAAAEDNKQGKEDSSDAQDKIMAPDFTLSDGKGNDYTLSDYKGKLVLVNFFTTWCGYCEEEMPDFQKIHEKYKDEDVAIIAVDVQTSPKEIPVEDVITWVEERNLTFPVVFDEEGTTTNEYAIRAFPTTYVIDKEGYVIGYVNAMNEEMLEQLISKYR